MVRKISSGQLLFAILIVFKVSKAVDKGGGVRYRFTPKCRVKQEEVQQKVINLL